MNSDLIVALGNPPIYECSLEEVVAQFHWRLQALGGIRDLEKFTGSDITAIFIHARSLDASWMECLSAARIIAPEARAIVCHGFAEILDWDVLSQTGAYHSLACPLKRNEVVQALGFVESARQCSSVHRHPADQARAWCPATASSSLVQ